MNFKKIRRQIHLNVLILSPNPLFIMIITLKSQAHLSNFYMITIEEDSLESFYQSQYIVNPQCVNVGHSGVGLALDFSTLSSQGRPKGRLTRCSNEDTLHTLSWLIPYQGTYPTRVHTLSGRMPYQGTCPTRAHTLPGRIPYQGAYPTRAHTLSGHMPYQGAYPVRPHTLSGHSPYQGTYPIRAHTLS